MVPYDLEVGYGIRKDSYSIVRGERLESRVYGYQFHPRDGTGLFCTRINIDYGGGGNMYHGSAQTGLALDIGPVRINPAFRRGEPRSPRVWNGRRALWQRECFSSSIGEGRSVR